MSWSRSWLSLAPATFTQSTMVRVSTSVKRASPCASWATYSHDLNFHCLIRTPRKTHRHGQVTVIFTMTSRLSVSHSRIWQIRYSELLSECRTETMVKRTHRGVAH